ncbi:TonB-dependent receptor [Moraxella sp. ZY210820]|uniref:TonB-dependent receptor n=1 Tax=Moraxella sp. ZY210820 TaxID=2904123 RepID=UPI00273131F1|nr:TonB-dependent receptor [Moraxella sp. ZY210820]
MLNVLKKAKIVLALLSLGASSMIWADTTQVLPTIEVTAEQESSETNLLGKRPNVSDQTIQAKELKQSATTLGDALSGELGIHSNQFGGGASAPIIRGQEGKRIKVLANNADVVDMANMSPDHAISVDTHLAKQVELVRGATTLLYSSGNAAGVVNVIDNKIPSALPNHGFEAEAGFRFNTNSNEKLTTLGTTIGLGKNFAVRLEGLNRDVGNYKTPNHLHPIHEFEHGEIETTYQKLNYLPESWAKGKVGTVGLSWLGKHGYLGASLTERREKYGLPAHSHAYEQCQVSVIMPRGFRDEPYLAIYPHLVSKDTHINWENAKVHHCEDSHTHAGHSHDDEHEHESAWIDLKSKRYEIRGEWLEPVKGIAKTRLHLARTDYKHDEKEGSEANSFFKNKGTSARLEFAHQPIGELQGVWGIQYLNSKNSATEKPKFHYNVWKKRYEPVDKQPLLNNNETKNISLFGLEQLKWNNFTFELSGRAEQQKVSMDYDVEAISDIIDRKCGTSYSCRNEAIQDKIQQTVVKLKPHKENAYSYALSTHWQFKPNYTLSLNLSHQERVPNAQELYAHGMHLATNSFEMGNIHLRKEKSNNFELGLGYQGDKLDYKLSSYLYDFDNYIYLFALNENSNTFSVDKDNRLLRINRYEQSKARFYGVEAQIGYQFTPVYYVSFFGDYVRGRLKDLPDVVDETHWLTGEPTSYKSQADRYTPRLPPMRLGTRIKANFDENWSGNVEFIRTFDQNKLSKFESKTNGYDMLNMGLNYQGRFVPSEYDVFFKANNLLDQKVYAHETYLPYIPQMGRNFSLGVNWKF